MSKSVTSPQADLTFAELRLAGMLHRPTTAVAVGQLQELAKSLVPTRTLEGFMDSPSDISANLRVIRQTDKLGLLASTLADMVIQIDRFAALNSIDLAAAIRQRFELETETT